MEYNHYHTFVVRYHLLLIDNRYHHTVCSTLSLITTAYPLTASSKHLFRPPYFWFLWFIFEVQPPEIGLVSGPNSTVLAIFGARLQAVCLRPNGARYRVAVFHYFTHDAFFIGKNIGCLVSSRRGFEPFERESGPQTSRKASFRESTDLQHEPLHARAARGSPTHGSNIVQ